jgi:cytochrome P450
LSRKYSPIAQPAKAARYCIGAALAKRQLYLTISELFRRFPAAELAEEPEKDAGDHNAIVFKRLLIRTNA